MIEILDWTLAVVATLIGLRALWTIAWHRGRAAAWREMGGRYAPPLFRPDAPLPFRKNPDTTRRSEP